MYKPIPIEEKFKKLKTRFLGALKCFYPWTGNESAGDDVENCENPLLTKSLTCLVILYQSELKYS